MYCAISGEVALEPVVSTKSGHVFERRLIEKALEASGGICPITNIELDAEKDLLPLKIDIAVRPRPVTATSIPGILSMFQNEWDDLMLETHQLKQKLSTTRKELSYALYQNEAASRVIARLTKENDDARHMMNDLQSQLASKEAQVVEARSHQSTHQSSAMNVLEEHSSDALKTNTSQPHQEVPPSNGKQGADTQRREAAAATPRSESHRTDQTDDMVLDQYDDTVMPPLADDVIQILDDFFKTASKARRSRGQGSKVSANREEMATWTEVSTINLPVDLSCVSNPPQEWSSLYGFILGASDGSLRCLDKDNTKCIATQKSHDSRVLTLKTIPSTSLLMSSGFNDVALWQLNDDTEMNRILTIPSTVFLQNSKKQSPPPQLTGSISHPTGKYVYIGTSDGGWGFIDLQRPTVPLSMTTSPPPGSASGALASHPDGIIIAIPNQTKIRIWDNHGPQNVLSFSDHEFPIHSIAFCENGYYMASADSRTVRLWDLRKPACVQLIETNDGSYQDHSTFRGVCEFDASGKFLAYANDRAYAFVNYLKPWSTTVSAPVFSTHITSLAFAHNTRGLALCAGMGRFSLLGPSKSAGGD